MNQNILKVDFGYVKFEKGDYFIKLGKRKDNKLIPQIKHCQKLIKNMKKMQKYQKKSYYNREIRLICPKSRTLQLNCNDNVRLLLKIDLRLIINFVIFYLLLKIF